MSLALKILVIVVAVVAVAVLYMVGSTMYFFKTKCDPKILMLELKKLTAKSAFFS